MYPGYNNPGAVDMDTYVKHYNIGVVQTLGSTTITNLTGD